MIPPPDSLALLLLCSHLGLPSGTDAENAVAPFTLKEWNPLARKLQGLSLRPGDLLGFSAADFQSRFSYTADEAYRLGHLLERSDDLSASLEQLESFGIFVLTRADPDYPSKYRQRLKESTPPVLFYAGEKDLLGQPGIAVVGSRHLDPTGEECASYVGNACGVSGLVLYSGGARGVDTISMNEALKSRGTAVGILADSLERTVRNPDHRAALQRGDLCLVTPYSPNAGFSVGAAMGRNRLIYTLADYAIVVASDAESGGTWAGATEALKNDWVPVFVLEHPQMPEGNRQLIGRGASPFPYPFPVKQGKLLPWLQEHSAQPKRGPEQLGLF